ncbi:hypothetical protein A2526_04330 [candidate division WOR-1 bacterium RIFOXYD2_FULL_36_8]|uniref:PorV/PorQ family protein n=1 Tax=candidate division WOR-1 bacterium RIFOXYB2_FULL_36_35 TaxID=1802578 RepID=A0A1F4RYT8_UNCSA|nr:MAG: hypothetical protein A2230_07875 [candidate division WOR-1 bacterium RIFOXYA2_FULL_36_21]OGC13356.1 MAG: hypothetical protein A2290_02505 [candidate division WOR-1 bacterium RIFOXYB2_FULL_36_35]OGC16601.1 MAG: hypothetical protein A2282_09345 [candidate division WOR-1 bacterium RIFOXYA12_FULL_36_13]OGC40676.1 MAG: hypothetical protein A2526_04330 [candidate division WOR-1 bacterium RIFOXYD2_FULL_36_8]
MGLTVSPSMAFFTDLGIIPFQSLAAARPLGIGEAVSAISDVDSAYYNPGCLAWSKGISINLKDLNNISAAQSFTIGEDTNLGLAFSTTKTSNINLSSGGTATVSRNIVAVSFAVNLATMPLISNYPISKSIDTGISFKMLLNGSISQTGLTDQTGSGYDIDAGLYYKHLPWLSFGVSGHNVLPKNILGGGVITWKGIEGNESIPAIFKTGVAAKIIGDLRSPIYMENKELIISCDIEKPLTGNFIYHLGGEFAFENNLFARAGVSTLRNGEVNLSCGGGVKFEGWGGNVSYNTKDNVTQAGVLYLNFLYYPKEWGFISDPIISLYPADETSTYKTTQIVSGEVKPETKLKINGVSIETDENNNFSTTVNLEHGTNIIVVESAYKGNDSTRIISVNLKKPPENPFENINIYDNPTFEYNETETTVVGKLKDGATAMAINGTPVSITDLNFDTNINLITGENHVDTTVYFEDQPVQTGFTLYRKEKPKPVAVYKPKPKQEPKPVVTPKPKPKVIPKAKPKTQKHVKQVVRKPIKINYQKVKQIIKAKTGITIKGEAKLKLPGYFAVYVLGGEQYIALKNIGSGFISIDYYNALSNKWKVIDVITYSELLTFN